ncbi:MAG: hypothetical protein AB7O92_32695 [Acidimicrobiia bacterium]
MSGDPTANVVRDAKPLRFDLPWYGTRLALMAATARCNQATCTCGAVACACKGIVEVKPHARLSSGWAALGPDAGSRTPCKWVATYSTPDAAGRVHVSLHTEKRRPALRLGWFEIPSWMRSYVPAGSGAFGQLSEPLVRLHFGRALGDSERVKNLSKSGQSPGPDIVWLELAEFFSELERELEAANVV